jgi:hypothetical protein
MDNHALNSLDQFEGAVVAVLDRLRRPRELVAAEFAGKFPIKLPSGEYTASG